MFTESKVIEIFCLADDFCKFFDALLDRYSIKEEGFAPKGGITAYYPFPRKVAVNVERSIDNRLALF